MQEVEVQGHWWLKCPSCGFMKDTGKYKYDNVFEGEDDNFVKEVDEWKKNLS